MITTIIVVDNNRTIFLYCLTPIDMHACPGVEWRWAFTSQHRNINVQPDKHVSDLLNCANTNLRKLNVTASYDEHDKYEVWLGHYSVDLCFCSPASTKFFGSHWFRQLCIIDVTLKLCAWSYSINVSVNGQLLTSITVTFKRWGYYWEETVRKE